MRLSFLPLLQIQRDLYAIPRGMERFREYIKTMTVADTGDLALPLVAMNPMGKDHIPALIDEYLALGAEEIARKAVDDRSNGGSNEGSSEGSSEGSNGGSNEGSNEGSSEGSREGSNVREFKVGLVVSDDLKGGWTNRWASEYSHRVESAAFLKRGFLTGILWTSEPASAASVREAVLTSIYRAEYLQTHVAPTTLGGILEQEGYAMARANCVAPALDEDDLAYSRSVIAPHLDATARATIVACMFGDAAARALGYPPQGLSDRAGLAVALSDARAQLPTVG